VRGFTRVELIVVLTTAALLVTVLRPVWAVPGGARTVVCLDNHRRLAAGWLVYAADHRGRLVPNLHGGAVQPGNANWALGWLDWTVSSNNTNAAYLVEARYAALAPYVGPIPSLFKCPADEYLSPTQRARGWTARVRSYAMNGNLGPGNSKDLFGPGYAVYESLNDFRRLPPSQAFVFVEEHPDSINDPCFFVNLGQAAWTDMPAAFHDGAAWFSFADGHVELRHWQSARTLLPVKVGPYSGPILTTASDPDYAWLKARTSERR